MRIALLLSVALLSVPSLGTAAPTITCHCFRDREYDPARPEAAEPYVLATARNSLLSEAFGIEKGPIVRKLMSGSSPDDLWVAYWAAWRTGSNAERLETARLEKGSWKAALTGADPTRFGTPFARALASGASEAALAGVAVDDVLVSRLKADPEVVRGLRAKGAATSEVILSTLLSSRAKRPPADLFADVKGGKGTWGGLLQGLGLAPKDIQPEIRRALR